MPSILSSIGSKAIYTDIDYFGQRAYDGTVEWSGVESSQNSKTSAK